MRFYAGHPLRDENGYNIGALCIIDQEPRQLTEVEQQRRQDLAQVVMGLFKLRLALHQRLDQASATWVKLYVPVARIRLPRQEAYSEARQAYVEGLSFSPGHSLEAHRPLGSVMRARLQAYPALSTIRRQGNHNPLVEPVSIDQVPA